LTRIIPRPAGRSQFGGRGGPGGAGSAQARFRGRSQPVDAGLYKVTLIVNGEEVATHDLRIVDDPILYPDKP